MSSQSNLSKISLSVVLFVLVLFIGFSLISASPAEAVENHTDSRTAELEQQIAQYQKEIELLIQTNAQQSQLIEQLRAEAETQYILVLRHEDTVLPGLFGDSITVNCRIQEISVSKAFFDSCEAGDDITSSQFHRLLASGSISQTRVIVESKYTR